MSSMILHTKKKILEPKDFYTEVRSKKDVDNFIENGLILLDVAENDLDKLLLGVIKKVNTYVFNICMIFVNVNGN